MVTEFGFIGHCLNIEKNHDKIWGYFYRPTEVYIDPGHPHPHLKKHQLNIVIFWARRGKAMQFKVDVENYNVHKLIASKLEKGYKKISKTRFLEIWPSFIKECEEKLMWDILAGRIK